jgi:hypothetical protein
MTAQNLAMNRAFDAMKQFAVGNEAPVHELARHDSEALAFMRGLHPDYPIDWVRDRWPGEVVEPIRGLMDGKVHCCRTVGEIQEFIRVVLTCDAASAAAAEALQLQE